MPPDPAAGSCLPAAVLVELLQVPGRYAVVHPNVPPLVGEAPDRTAFKAWTPTHRPLATRVAQRRTTRVPLLLSGQTRVAGGAVGDVRW